MPNQEEVFCFFDWQVLKFDATRNFEFVGQEFDLA
jgi:hypothetical protein